MADARIERIKEFAITAYGPGEYTVERTDHEAVLRDASGTVRARAGDLVDPGDHVAALLRYMRRKVPNG